MGHSRRLASLVALLALALATPGRAQGDDNDAVVGGDGVVQDPNTGLPWWGFVDGAVQETLYRDLMDLPNGRSPGVIRDAPSKQWAALEKWKDREYLASHIQELKTVVSQTATNVYLAPLRAMGKIEYTGQRKEAYESTIQAKEVLNMSFADLMTGLDDNSPGAAHHYGTTDLSQFCDSGLCDDLGDKEILWIKDKHVKLAEDEPHTNKLHLWIGKPGTISGAHYDVFHNVYVQVTGRKRFLIADVEHANRAHLFPYLHPHSRHSMLDLLPQESFPEVNYKIPFLVVDLEPGDMLYIPPHWIHRVLPLPTDDPNELSVSVNGWTLSTEALFAELMRSVRIPKLFLDDSAEEHVKAAALRGLMLNIVTNIQAVLEQEAMEYVHTVFTQRYHGAIAEALGCEAEDHQVEVCPGETELTEKQINDVARSSNLLNQALGQARSVSKIKTKVLNVLMADYMEVLAEHVFKYPKACHYIRCMAFFDHFTCPATDLLEDE